MEQSPEGALPVKSWGKSTWAGKAVCAKAQGLHRAWCGGRTERRPVWLGQNEREGE